MTNAKNTQEEGFAQVNGVRLHYVQQGEGPLLLLLHGFPEHWYSWRYQLPFLAERFQGIAPDLRGYNTSDKPSGVSAYFLEELMGDVRGLIQHFGREKAVIVGHDWGGVIAWNLAAFYPEVVERLVIMNAPHPLAFLRELRRNPRQRRASWYIFMFQIPKLPEWYVRRANYEMIEKAFAGWAVRKEAFTDEDLRRFKEAMRMPGCLTAAINYYRSLFRDPANLRRLRNFPPIGVPTRIIWADRDRALTNELTHDLGPYFSVEPEIKYVSQCSHWVQQEQPDIVNRHLADFLF